MVNSLSIKVESSFCQGDLPSSTDEVTELRKSLQKEIHLKKAAEEEVNNLTERLLRSANLEVWFMKDQIVLFFMGVEYYRQSLYQKLLL